MKATTSTIFWTHAYLLLALHPLNIMKTIRRLTLPRMDHFRLNFGEAMHNELTTLTQEFNCWEYVPQTQEMNVLPSTWAFKIKRYPDGRV